MGAWWEPPAAPPALQHFSRPRRCRAADAVINSVSDPQHQHSTQHPEPRQLQGSRGADAKAGQLITLTRPGSGGVRGELRPRCPCLDNGSRETPASLITSCREHGVAKRAARCCCCCWTVGQCVRIQDCQITSEVLLIFFVAFTEKGPSPEARECAAQEHPALSDRPGHTKTTESPPAGAERRLRAAGRRSQGREANIP